MTSKKKHELPTHVRIGSVTPLLRSTIIMAEQIKTIDKSRIRDFVCCLDGETMDKLDEAIKISLALYKEEKGVDLMEADKPKIFSNEEFGEVRIVLQDGEPWFVAKDVAIALGYKNARDAVDAHVDSDDKGVAKCDTPGGPQNLVVINESGMYALIFGSKLTSAKNFKHWVTSEVLPSIRKTGSYKIDKPMTPEEMMRVQLGMIDGHEERISKLENTMNVDYGQQRVLEKEVAKTVIDSLGGKDSPAYREMGKKVFAECNHDVKDYFHVNSRNNIPRLRFDDAVEYIRNWTPCTNTRVSIQECNTQIMMKSEQEGAHGNA